MKEEALNETRTTETETMDVMSIALALAVTTQWSRQLYLKVWFQTQGGWIVTEQSLKTGRGEYNYFSRVTELQ